MEYINREDVMSYVYEISPCKSDYFYIGVAEEMVLNTKKEIADALEKLSYTDDVQEVVHSKWRHYPDSGAIRCSSCDWSAKEAWTSNYCPNCGAKMDL